MKKFGVLIICGLFVVLGALNHINAASGDMAEYKAGGGGDLPWPLSANQKVELADGEIYLLVGWVHYFGSEPYLEVDLDIHPWLSNYARFMEPYYPLEDTASCWWKRYEGKHVKVLVKAKGIINRGDAQTAASYTLSLRPISEPLKIAGHQR